MLYMSVSAASTFYKTYYLIYFGIILIFLPLFLYGLPERIHKGGKLCAYFVIIILSVYLGYRSLFIGSDTQNYSHIFANTLNFSSLSDYVKSYNGDYAFYITNYLLSLLVGVHLYFTLMAFFLIWAYYFMIQKMYKNDYLIILLLFVGMFFTLALGSNIIRNGFGLSFLFLFIGLDHVKDRKAYIFLVLSLLSHSTILIFLVVYFSVRYFKLLNNLKFIITLLFVAIVTSYLGYGFNNIPLFENYLKGSTNLALYLQDKASKNYDVGFRWSFTIFNLLFIYMGFITYTKLDSSIPWYYKVFILLTVIFVLDYNLPYSDRIGIYSWIFIPIVCFDFVMLPKVTKYKFAYKLYLLILIFLVGISLIITLNVQ